MSTKYTGFVSLLPSWYYALLTSGKNTPWLGWERYPFVAVGLFVFTVITVVCIVKCILILKERKGVISYKNDKDTI